jgi:hypothetical protein
MVQLQSAVENWKDQVSTGNARRDQLLARLEQMEESIPQQVSPDAMPEHIAELTGLVYELIKHDQLLDGRVKELEGTQLLAAHAIAVLAARK